MKYAISLAPGADAWKTVKRAEQLGFTRAWFYDTQLLCADIFVAMAAAAMQTSRIRLSTGVIIPSNRIEPVTACGLASLNQLAPGRIDFGVGTGFTGRRSMGVGGIKLADMHRYVDKVYQLLGRDITEIEIDEQRRKIRFLNPELDLINTTDPIPFYVSAMGPKSRRLTAEMGGGWLNFMATAAAAADDVKDMLKHWQATGRDPKTCDTSGFTLGCVLKPGEAYDSPRAKAQAGPHAAVILHNMMEASERGDLHVPAGSDLSAVLAEYRKVYETYTPADARYLTLHRGHLMFLRPEEERFISGEFLRDVTFTGTAPELRDRIRAMRDAGYTEFTIQIVNGQEQALDEWAEIIAGV